MRTFEAVLVVADISGYTKFVVMNKSSIVHAEQIITELMETIIKSAEPILRVQKLEGDAVFMVAEIESERRETINNVTRIVSNFMQSYREKQKELFRNSVGGCACSACQSIENLHLKCAIHVGEILEKEVEGRPELAGEPVIVVHRLMKNSFDANGYLLATKEVSTELEFSPFPERETHEELVTDIGHTKVEAYFSKEVALDRNSAQLEGWTKRKREGLRLLFRWVLAYFKKGRAKFNNMPT